jgi:hypothetical protein
MSCGQAGGNRGGARGEELSIASLTRARRRDGGHNCIVPVGALGAFSGPGAGIARHVARGVRGRVGRAASLPQCSSLDPQKMSPQVAIDWGCRAGRKKLPSGARVL